MPKEITWTIEKIKEGFEKFYSIHNRYPTAYDVDDFENLPSSRQIQRSFGGLVNLRKLLNLKVKNYTKGNSRALTVKRINIRGRKYENIVYKLLLNHFDYKFIHIEKPIISSSEYDSKDRYDFYVYAKPTNFAIDVFVGNDDRGVINIFNIKEKKYRKVDMNENECLYFLYIVENESYKNKLHSWIYTKIKKIPKNWKILSMSEFTHELKNYSSFKAI
jgi:hypothetical protein